MITAEELLRQQEQEMGIDKPSSPIEIVLVVVNADGLTEKIKMIGELPAFEGQKVLFRNKPIIIESGIELTTMTAQKIRAALGGPPAGHSIWKKALGALT